eukprot:7208953-Pyramimonas_sp.AAC.1
MASSACQVGLRGPDRPCLAERMMSVLGQNARTRQLHAEICAHAEQTDVQLMNTLARMAEQAQRGTMSYADLAPDERAVMERARRTERQRRRRRTKALDEGGYRAREGSSSHGGAAGRGAGGQQRSERVASRTKRAGSRGRGRGRSPNPQRAR